MIGKKALKRLRIILALLLFASLILPWIYMSAEQVEFVYTKQIMEIQTEGEFSVSFSKNIKFGALEVSYYDDDNVIVKTEIFKFNELNKDQEKTFEIPEQSVATRYQITKIEVYTTDSQLVQELSSIFAALMFLGLVVSLRIKQLEIESSGHIIKVYSGIRNNKLLIDGNVVAERKSIFFVDSIFFKVDFEETKLIEAEITCNKKITMKITAREQDNVADVTEPEVDDATKKMPAKETKKKRTVGTAKTTEKTAKNTTKTAKKPTKTKNNTEK